MVAALLFLWFLNSLFQPFHGGFAKGAGLGLAIAREVARAHGGDVRCDEAPAGGARFTVTLPVPPASS